MKKETFEMIERVKRLGITEADAWAIRRISMTLQRWFELECGDGNDYSSWTIARGRKEVRQSPNADGNGVHRESVFIHDEDGEAYLETHYHRDGRTLYTRTPDREKGARKRLEKIMDKYTKISAYIQTDPRGASLYLLRIGIDVKKGEDVTSVYSRGTAVYK